MWRFDQYADDAKALLTAAEQAIEFEAKIKGLLAANVRATLALFELQRTAATKDGWVHPRRDGA
jgi:hypothetical protein